MTRSSKGFTLVELLVVIIVLGILIAIAVPSFIGVRDNARKASRESDVTVLYHNAKAYWASQDADGIQENFGSSDSLVDALEVAEPAFAGDLVTTGASEGTAADDDTYAVYTDGDDAVSITATYKGDRYSISGDEEGAGGVSVSLDWE